MRDSVRDALRKPWPALVLLVVSATLAAEPLSVSIQVKSRETAPGEPLRIAVRSPWPVLDIEGEFLGQSLFWVRDDDGADGERWSAWTMVGLDQEPGSATVEVRGMTTEQPFFASLPTEIRVKDFPEERLDVAPSYVEPPPEVRERLAAERARLVEIYRTRRATQPTEPFIRPVPGAQTSIFGTRRIFNGKPRSPHSGGRRSLLLGQHGDHRPRQRTVHAVRASAGNPRRRRRPGRRRTARRPVRSDRPRHGATPALGREDRRSPVRPYGAPGSTPVRVRPAPCCSTTSRSASKAPKDSTLPPGQCTRTSSTRSRFPRPKCTRGSLLD